jgi:hypothetical protein
VEGGEFGTKDPETIGRDAIGAAAIFGRERLDEALLLEAADGAVECAGAEARAAEDGDVFDHGVAVLGAVGEAGEDEERGIGIVGGGVAYYVARTTHDVVIAQARGLRKSFLGELDRNPRCGSQLRFDVKPCLLVDIRPGAVYFAVQSRPPIGGL